MPPVVGRTKKYYACPPWYVHIVAVACRGSQCFLFPIFFQGDPVILAGNLARLGPRTASISTGLLGLDRYLSPPLVRPLWKNLRMTPHATCIISAYLPVTRQYIHAYRRGQVVCQRHSSSAFSPFSDQPYGNQRAVIRQTA